MNQALTKALVTQADFGKVTAIQMHGLVEYLDGLPPALVDRLLSNTEGIQTATKFVPTIADFNELRAKLVEKDNQFKSHPTSGYKRLTEARGPWDEETDYERKKRLVKEVLGYDPNDPVARRDPPAFKTKKIEEFKSSADCARQDQGPSKELLELIERQDSDPVRWS